MPLLFWPLLAGSIGYVGGLFTGEAVSRTVKLLIAVLIALWLYNKLTGGGA
ncbi:hypothetical protein [Photobacterium atrarenae]|uniref:Membrane transporter protein n=1 Tax=Photobacterium atrarenae TaxID=865757 RepID=A0ABY5GE29_9GAMM|nr:hypothetical protein [Photobacterium atrarenae]UTV27502.1 hypothetical protein NNL38_14495 [Photobacterium atrarenae]